MSYNQEDLEKMLEECKSELAASGYEAGPITGIEISSRMTRAWGKCRKSNDGTFLIRIAKRLVENGSYKGVKQTVMHEVIHTITSPNCFNHGANFKKVAEKINRRYNYGIKTRSSSEDKGMPLDWASPESSYVKQVDLDDIPFS